MLNGIFILVLFAPLTIMAQILPSSLKHSIDPTCHYQVAQSIIMDANDRYSSNYQILTSGLFIQKYAQLESYPAIHLSKAVITLKNKTNGLKREVYYTSSSGSVGLGRNNHPIHRCKVTVDLINRTEYERIQSSF